MYTFFLSILLGTAAPTESLPDGFVTKTEPEVLVIEVTTPHKGRYCGIHMIVDGRHELVLLELKPGETLLYEEKLHIECSNAMKKIHKSKEPFWEYKLLPSGRSKWTPGVAP